MIVHDRTRLIDRLTFFFFPPAGNVGDWVSMTTDDNRRSLPWQMSGECLLNGRFGRSLYIFFI
jgi:hypothetical protein